MITKIPVYGGVVPQRTQSPSEFSKNADNFVDYQANLAEPYNELAAEVNAMAESVQGVDDSVAESVTQNQAIQEDIDIKASQVATNTQTVNEKTQIAIDAQSDVTEKSQQVSIDTQNVANNAQQVSINTQTVSDNKDLAQTAAITATEQATIATDAAAQMINVVHMQSANSDVDEYGYPLRTLYKNGDGMIVYYPEYSVFRKDGGSWKRIDPHLRNVVSFNGTTQYATAPRVTEIDMDDPDLGFEVEWGCYLDSDSKPMDVLNHSNVKGVTSNEFRVRYLTQNGEYRLYLYVGGSNTVLALVSGFGWHNYRVTYNKSTSLAKCWVDDVYQGQKSLSVGVHREPDANLMIGALDNGGTLQDFFAGEISDLRIWTGGDRNTGVLTRDYRMDEGWRGDKSLLLNNYATVQREWVMVEQPFDSQPYTYDAQYPATIVANLPVELLDSYFHVTTTVTNYETAPGSTSTSPVGFLVANWSAPIAVSNSYGNGDLNFTAAAKATAITLYTRGARDPNPNQCTFSNISIIGSKGSGQYMGTTEASWTQETV